MQKRTLCILALFMFLNNAIAAENPYIEISGGIPVVVIPTRDSKDLPKYVILEKVTLSPTAKSDLTSRFLQNTAILGTTALLPAKKDLGMSTVPVLDQGMHGTCVTFASSAAIDAAIFHNDYISQLCNLELGEYLHHQDDSYPSGWDGSFGTVVLDQIQQYGIIDKNVQSKQGCAGVRQYPTSDPNNTGNPMSIAEFEKHSQSLTKSVSWKLLFDRNETPNTATDQIVTQVKTALASGNRVIFGTLLDTHMGVAGAIGAVNHANDAWMVTPALMKDVEKYWLLAGHEMVIEGYNDSIIIKGPNNTAETGAFILRNSWGPEAGDQGNFYMSYNYFQQFAMDANEIIG